MYVLCGGGLSSAVKETGVEGLGSGMLNRTGPGICSNNSLDSFVCQMVDEVTVSEEQQPEGHSELSSQGGDRGKEGAGVGLLDEPGQQEINSTSGSGNSMQQETMLACATKRKQANKASKVRNLEVLK